MNRPIALQFRSSCSGCSRIHTSILRRRVELPGSPAFQQKAWPAQRQSLVLLENRNNILPLSAASGKRAYLHRVDPKIAARYGFTVVSNLSKADIAIVRTDAPFQTLHPNYMFGAMQHEGRLDFQAG